MTSPSLTSVPGSDSEPTFKNNLPSEFPENQSSFDLRGKQLTSSVALGDQQRSKVNGSPPSATYTNQNDTEHFRCFSGFKGREFEKYLFHLKTLHLCQNSWKRQLWFDWSKYKKKKKTPKNSNITLFGVLLLLIILERYNWALISTA